MPPHSCRVVHSCRTSSFATANRGRSTKNRSATQRPQYLFLQFSSAVRSQPLPSAGHHLLLLQAVPHPPIPTVTAGTTVRSLPTTEAVQRRNDEEKKLLGFWWPIIIDMEMNNYADALLLFF
ncbi:uncharacterized protein [Triticum aestivum]|uniref:uncharacterized protein isoform X1 n=1 Tax=Triticum aestivum TaxID=4565 RepID=UPI001D029797|nr:uncharacterized protein LOC123090667 isoform X1 [Triticum aestivum]